MFDGDIAAGPVPLLFAANPDEAAASIAAEPAKAHFDLSKVTFINLINLLFQLCNKSKYENLDINAILHYKSIRIRFVYRYGARSSSTRL
jgi:hypothetical protein